MARMYTGRKKIMSRYRSYHGSSVATLATTGDQRRWNAEAGASGHVHFFDPYPYGFKWGATEAEVFVFVFVFVSQSLIFSFRYIGYGEFVAIFARDDRNGGRSHDRCNHYGIRHCT